jgi:hypothetical protein
MTVHPSTSPVEQDGAFGAVRGGPVDRPGDGWREWGEDDLAALASDLQHPVSVFFTQVFDVGTARFGDPQSEQAEHRNQGEVEPVGRIPRGREHRFELKV